MKETAFLLFFVSCTLTLNAQEAKFTRSSVIDGYKCYHYEYEDGSLGIRQFSKENGDYIWFREDPDGLDRIPDKREESLLSYRITTSRNDTLTCIPRVLYIVFSSGYEYGCNPVPLSWDAFTQAREDFSAFPNSDIYGLSVRYVYSKKYDKTFGNKNGYIEIGNNRYKFNQKGNVWLVQKTINIKGLGDRNVYCCMLDSIVGANLLDASGKYEVLYANDDKVILQDGSEYLQNGTVIHRKNGILRVKNNRINFTLNDGSVFVGEFDNPCVGPQEDLLQYEQLIPLRGTIQTRDGKIENFVKTGDSEPTKVNSLLKY